MRFGLGKCWMGIGLGMLVILFQNCGGSGGGHGSCNLAGVGYCIHYVGSAYASIQSINQVACQSGKGVWSGGGCPSTDAVGFCRTAKGSLNEIFITYYKGIYISTDAAKTACNSGVGGNSAGAGEFTTP